jgi:hypothetical protein
VLEQQQDAVRSVEFTGWEPVAVMDGAQAVYERACEPVKLERASFDSPP